jgi:hypothetical protein
MRILAARGAALQSAAPSATEEQAVQRAVGQECVIMWQQKPSDVVFLDDV